MENKKTNLSEVCQMCNNYVCNFMEASDPDKDIEINYKVYFCDNCKLGFIPNHSIVFLIVSRFRSKRIFHSFLYKFLK